MKNLNKKKNDFLVLANKLIEKVSDPCNVKEHYESFFKKKNQEI